MQKETGKTIFFDFSDIQILKAPVFQETPNRPCFVIRLKLFRLISYIALVIIAVIDALHIDFTAVDIIS